MRHATATRRAPGAAMSPVTIFVVILGLVAVVLIVLGKIVSALLQ